MKFIKVFHHLRINSFVLIVSCLIISMSNAEELPDNITFLLESYNQTAKIPQPSYIDQLTWHDQLSPKPNDVSILDQLWYGDSPDGRITALKLISQNYHSKAVYQWLKKQVINNNDLDLVVHLIDIAKPYSSQEATFWLHYYTLASIEDAATCKNPKLTTFANNNTFSEVSYLYQDINITEEESKKIADEVIKYNQERPARPHWKTICAQRGSTSTNLRITDEQQRETIKKKIREYYFNEFKQQIHK